jgi:hypothetical protein
MCHISLVMRVLPLLLACVFQTVCAQSLTDSVPFQIEHLMVGKTIYQDCFDSDLSQWVIEQMPGGRVVIDDGKLEIDDSAGCTVWFKYKLTAPVLIEYMATLVSSNGKNDRVSDLNCFWMAVDPENLRDIFANGTARNGKFADYHCLRLYYVGYGANNNTTTRLRRYPGDCTRPLIKGIEGKEDMNVPNVARKIQIISTGTAVLFVCDGKILFDFKDPDPYTEGWFGFRTVNNHMIIDDFRIQRIVLQKEGESNLAPAVIEKSLPIIYE